MHTRSVKMALLLLVVVCIGSALPAWAQSTDSGTVVGTVTDPSGAVVPGVAVTLTDISTNVSRSTVTNESGRYTVVNVTPGTYNLTFAKQGFANTKVNRQQVTVGLAVTQNISLQVGT